MAKYLRVKENTVAFKMLHDVFNYKKKWAECRKEIEEFLGFDYDKSLYLNVDVLQIEPKFVKEEWKDQFKKNHYPAEAKRKSKINLAWVSLCKELGLEVHTPRKFSMTYGFYFTKLTYYCLDDGFYLEFEEEKSNLEKFDWAEEISESEFFRLRAKEAEKTEKEKSA